MARVSLKSIIPLLTKQEHSDGPLGLLREIIVLQSKIENQDGQDFYFQKGLANHISHLESLKKEYAQMVETVNTNTVDYFLEQVKEYEGTLKKLTSKRHLNTVDQIALGMITNQISKYKNLLHIKGQFGQLKPLEELMEDEETLIRVFAV
jgi:cell division FtsZ-interacting protein ZapD